MPTWGTGEFGEQNPWGGVFTFGDIVLPPPPPDDEDVDQSPGPDGCIHNHRAQALDRLVTQFRGKPNIDALISAYIVPIQSVEDALCQMLHQRALAAGSEPRTAIGAQLNILGKIVGFRLRGTLDDETYDRLIRATIIANKSQARFVDFIDVTSLVTGIDTGIVLERQNHATLVVRPTDDVTDAEEADFLMQFLHRVSGGGVRVILEFYPAPENERFAFAGGTGLGFGAGRFSGARSNGLTNQPLLLG